MMEENLFIYVEQSRVKHVASLFSAKKNDQKMKEGEEKKESDTWMD